MESILKTIKKKNTPINPAIIISNRPDAKGIKIAKKMKINTRIIQSKGFKGSKKEYDEKLMQCLAEYGVTPKNGLVCLAGFMRILSPAFIKKYKNQIINIHPALLPAFPGLNSQRQALEYGVKYSGCTVHFVDAGIDTGPIIIQSIVKINKTDTIESLTKKILKEEHKIYPKAVDMFARKKIKISK